MDADENRVGLVSPGEVYKRHSVELTRFATSLVGPADAADVVHEAVLSLLASGRLVEADNPRALLYRAVLARAHSFHRSGFRRRRREQRFVESLVTVDPERRPDVTAAMVRLSPHQRACVWLAYWEDLDAGAIAERLGIGDTRATDAALADAPDIYRFCLDLYTADLRINVAPTDPDAMVAAVSSIAGVDHADYISTELDPTSRSSFIVIRLTPGANPADVAARVEATVDAPVEYSKRILAALEDDYMFAVIADAEPIDGDVAFLLQAASAPSPQFDPSSLGRHVPMTPYESDTDLAPLTPALLREAERLGRDDTKPMLMIGHVDELDADLALIPSVDKGYCDAVIRDGATFTGCGYITGTRFGVQGGGSPPGHVTIQVPLETSVVVVTGADGDTMWQEPIGGWALLPVPTYTAALVTVDAYDAAGNPMGHWEETF